MAARSDPECRIDLGPGSGAYILVLRYAVPAIVLVVTVNIVRDLTSALFVAGLALLLAPVAWLAWRQALALEGMQALVTADEVRLTLPAWGTRRGVSLPLTTVAVPRVDIEAVEVDRNAAGYGLARRAALVLRGGKRVELWRYSEGLRKQWVWKPGKGWCEDTAATYVRSDAWGFSLNFRLMGALFGFADRLAAALDVPYQERMA